MSNNLKSLEEIYKSHKLTPEEEDSFFNAPPTTPAEFKPFILKAESLLKDLIPHMAIATTTPKEILFKYLNEYLIYLRLTYKEDNVYLGNLQSEFSKFKSIIDNKEEEHKQISKEIEPFLTDPPNTSLLISWGMGNKLQQMIPQDAQFLDKVFNKNKKNLILVFEPSEEWCQGITALMACSKETLQQNTNVLMNRILAVLKNATKSDPAFIFSKPSENSISCDWVINNIEYKFIFIKKEIDPLILLNYYMPIIKNTGRKSIVCNDYGMDSCKGRFDNLSIFNEYFVEMFYNYGGAPDSNLEEYQKQDKRVSGRITKEFVNSGENIWNHLTGGSRGRRGSRGSRGSRGKRGRRVKRSRHIRRSKRSRRNTKKS